MYKRVRHKSEPEPKKPTVDYSADAKSLEEQLNEYGYTLGERAEVYQKALQAKEFLWKNNFLILNYCNEITERVAKGVDNYMRLLSDVEKEEKEKEKEKEREHRTGHRGRPRRNSVS